MILFSFKEQEQLAKNLSKEQGIWQWRKFPDGESYVQILTDVNKQDVAILCSLNDPDLKFLPLVFLAQTLRELGATTISLIAPYLGYMRQDIRFKAGEAITSEIFARNLSPYIDTLITIDPHLHRHLKLEEIYNCKCHNISAAPLMAKWIKKNVPNALIIGPDMESEQWVKIVAKNVGAPYCVLEKIRHGDKDVEITIKDISQYKNHIPVLVDDIISTAKTMIKAIELLKQQNFENIICVATHGLFAGNAYTELKETGATKIITTNTITHISNAIDIAKSLHSYF